MIGSNHSVSRTTECVAKLLARIDLSVDQGDFPYWSIEKDEAFVAAMRTTGFKLGEGAALVFEDLIYSPDEAVIKSRATFIGTTDVTSPTIGGGGVMVYLNSSDIGHIQSQEVGVVSRGRMFSVSLDRDELVRGGYLEGSEEWPTAETLALRISDVIPSDWIFSTSEQLCSYFKISPTIPAFVVQDWHHPTFEEAYVEGIKPSSFHDIQAMATAACGNTPLPELEGLINTSWRVQSRSKRARNT